jgi:trigger factor
VTVNKEITRLENSAVKLTVTIAKEDVASEYTQMLAKYAKTIQVPGFRKGKVPPSVLEQKYGEALKADAISDIIEKTLGEIFEELEEKPLPYGAPIMNEPPKPTIDEDLVFSVEYDVLPKVEVKGLEGLSVEIPEVTVGDNELNEELKMIQERNALVVDKNDEDPAAKGDIVTVNYSELDDAGAVVDGTAREDFVFDIGSGYNIFKIDDDIVGMKKGETRDITKTYEADFSDAELAGKTKKIRVTVTALKVRNLPELDDELAQDVSEKYKTLADLKADIRKNLETSLKNKLDEIRNSALVEKLTEQTTIAIPKSMIEAELESRWRMFANQMRIDVEQLEKMMGAAGQTKESTFEAWRANSEQALKGRLIVETLMENSKIEVSPEDVEAEYAKIAEGAGVSVEEVQKHYAEPRAKEYLIDDIKEQRLYGQLFEKVKVVKGEKKAFSDLFNKD